MRTFMLAVATIFVAEVAIADSLASMEKATNLGSVIASEEFCDLTFDQDAIEDWIDQNVDPDDMGFPSTLNMMVMGSEFQHEGMSKSAKTAHCRSIKRVAKRYGFVE